MNPEEGDLRPQLLDRFGLSVTVRGERDLDLRVQVVENRLFYEKDPDRFFLLFEREQNALRERIAKARKILPRVTYTRRVTEMIALVCIKLEVDGHRADISTLKTAMTLAAFDGRTTPNEADVVAAAKLVLPHRMRRMPFEDVADNFGELLDDLGAQSVS
jgi:magnesium chelatase subunit I